MGDRMVTQEKYDRLNTLYENNMIEYDTLKNENDTLKEEIDKLKAEFNEFRDETLRYMRDQAKELEKCKQKIDKGEHDDGLFRGALNDLGLRKYISSILSGEKLPQNILSNCKARIAEMDAGTPAGRMLANRAGMMAAAAGPPPIPSRLRTDERGGESGEEGDIENEQSGGGDSRKRKRGGSKRKAKKGKTQKPKVKKTKRSRRSSRNRRR